jgi:serine/threonine-protein kinase
MLTGRRAFAGHTISEAIAAVLRDDVDWSRLPRGTPQELRRLLRRCLRKDVADRLQDVGDARIELAELAQEGGERAAPPRSRRFAVRALLALGLFGLAFALARGLPSGGGAPTTIRASLPLGPDVRLWLGASHTLALSPDGARLAFVGESDGRTQLYVRELAKDASQPVRNSADARAPFFSPDGRFIGFFAQGELRKVAVSGGVPERIAAAGIEPRGASWSEDGRIAFAQVGAPGLYVVPSRGGEPALLSTLDAASGELEHLWPEWLPGSGALLLSVRVRAPGGSAEELAVLAPRAQRPRRLRPGAQPAYARSGHVVYTRAGGLEAVPFDVRRLETSGTSVAVLESLNAYPQGAASFALSASGSFVYLPPVVATTLAWVGPDGSATPADAPPGTPGWPRLAPDGRRAAVHVGRPASREVWLIDVERPNAYRQLTFGGGGFPVWSPDGRRVAFFSRREGAPSLYVVDADGDGPPRRLLSAKGTTIPASWSGQGRLAFYEIAESTQRDIWVVDVDGDGVATPVVASPANELAPAFSPDGRALAYVSNETGRNEVYVRSYPGPGPVSAVSTDGGIEPVWSRDGSQLLYRHADELRSVPVRTTPRLSLGAARRLLRAEMVTNAAGNPGFDVKPDGSGYLMLRPVAGASTEEVRLLLNWVDELGQQSRAGR